MLIATGAARRAASAAVAAPGWRLNKLVLEFHEDSSVSSSSMPGAFTALAGTLAFEGPHSLQELTGRERMPLGKQTTNDPGE